VRPVADVDDVDRDSDQLDADDTLVDDDPLEGTSPAERPWRGTGWGTTPAEIAVGEDLDGRLRREVPEPDLDGGDGLGDARDTDGELLDDEVGDVRAGRLLAQDGGGPDDDEELWARDVGPDAGRASAEEAAVHVVTREHRLDGG
jgi:hypothetical protein